MFWIIGAEDLVHALRHASDAPAAVFLAGQLTHKEWEGFGFYDLIFPLFVFLAGVSIVFSLDRIVQQQGRAAAVGRVVRRSLLLYLLGVLYYGGIAKGLANVRWVGVLQRIAISYFAAAIVYLAARGRAWPIAIVTALILIAYWVLIAFVPLPGETSISFAPGENWANYIDRHYLPGFKWDGQWDPEGLLSSLPAIATCLVGVLAGKTLRNATLTDGGKVWRLLLAGVVLVIAGELWGRGLHFPVIKKVWTSSYVLVAGGYSLALLGAFYWIVDVWKVRFWTPPFVWIGTNALAVYLAVNIVDVPKLAERFVGGEIKAAFAPWDEMLVAVAGLSLALGFVRFLYRRQIFIRL